MIPRPASGGKAGVLARDLIRGRLVQKQPVHAKCPGCLKKLLKVDRLDNVAIKAKFVTLYDIPVLSGGRQNDDGSVTQLGVAPNLSQHLEAIHFRQLQIQQDKTRSTVFSV